VIGAIHPLASYSTMKTDFVGFCHFTAFLSMQATTTQKEGKS